MRLLLNDLFKLYQAIYIDITYDSAPAGSINHTFQYRKIFTQPPTNETDKVWEIMLPSMEFLFQFFFGICFLSNSTAYPGGRGFIKNPAISSDVMGVAVYHQLHCLVSVTPSWHFHRHNYFFPFKSIEPFGLTKIQDSLRRGYYAALNVSQRSMHLDRGHMRHCIDYLRQSLLCAADTNFEPVNTDLKGVTGWGNPRQCRDIIRVLQWTDQWRAHNQTNIL